MPEGDTVHRAAQDLRVLLGERLSVTARNARARATGVAESLDGLRLVAAEAHGKNLLLRFEGGRVLRSHLRMSGSWRVLPAEADVPGRPWLVLRGTRHQAVLRGGSVLELTGRAVTRLGPDILADAPDLDGMVARIRRADPALAIGEAILDQRLVAGIGNLWRAEALWAARVSPWLPLEEVSDDRLRAVLGEAARRMRVSRGRVRGPRAVYRRSGRPCPRCGARVRSHGQGEGNRTAYWCPGCQTGKEPPEA